MRANKIVRSLIWIASLMFSVSAIAADRELLLPAFAEDLPGAFGSIWRSELRIYNSDVVAHEVRVLRVFPQGGATCAQASSAFTIGPGESRQVRSLGCGSATVVAAELQADSRVVLSSVVTNTSPASITDRCCPTGFTQPVPLVAKATAYATKQSLPNVPVALDTSTGLVVQLNRHNVGVINPNGTELVITLRTIDIRGEEDWWYARTFTVPPFSMVQLANVLEVHTSNIGTIAYPSGYWRLEIDASLPFFVYDSTVDNTTNDATMTVP